MGETRIARAGCQRALTVLGLPFAIGSWVTSSIGLTSSLALTNCSSPSADPGAEPVPIGFIGDAASKENLNVLTATLRYINAEGGVELPDGLHPLSLVFESHDSSVEGATRAMHALADQGVSVVVDPAWSSMILGERPDHRDGAMQVAKDRDMVIMSGGATAAELTSLEDDGRVFRTVASDAVQAKVAADYVHEEGISTAGVIYRDDAWGRGLLTSFTAAFEALGGEVKSAVAYPAIDAQSRDFAAALDELFVDRPQAILLASFEEVYPLVEQIALDDHLEAYEDVPPLFVGTDGLYDMDAIVANFPAAVLDRLVGFTPRPDEESQDFLALIDLLRDEGLDVGTAADAPRHDAIMLLALAIQSVGSTEARRIKAELQDISAKNAGDVDIHVGQWAEARSALLEGRTINYEGASGAIEFDDHGDRSSGTIGLWRSQKQDDGYEIVYEDVIPYAL